jgi:hypothetical protein
MNSTIDPVWWIAAASAMAKPMRLPPKAMAAEAFCASTISANSSCRVRRV